MVESRAPYTEASLLAYSARCRVTEIKKRGKGGGGGGRPLGGRGGGGGGGGGGGNGLPVER